MKLVKDVMVRDVMTISPFASIREALSQMKQHSVKSLVVEKTSEHDAWGLITYTNVLKTVIAEDLPIGFGFEGDVLPLNVPTGVAVAKDGSVYFTSDIEAALYKLTPQ